MEDGAFGRNRGGSMVVHFHVNKLECKILEETQSIPVTTAGHQ